MYIWTHTVTDLADSIEGLAELAFQYGRGEAELALEAMSWIDHEEEERDEEEQDDETGEGADEKDEKEEEEEKKNEEQAVGVVRYLHTSIVFTTLRLLLLLFPPTLPPRPRLPYHY